MELSLKLTQKTRYQHAVNKWHDLIVQKHRSRELTFQRHSKPSKNHTSAVTTTSGTASQAKKKKKKNANPNVTATNWNVNSLQQASEPFSLQSSTFLAEGRSVAEWLRGWAHNRQGLGSTPPCCSGHRCKS